MIQVTCDLPELQGLIKTLRLRADITQGVLAGMAGYKSAAAISHFENDERTAKPADLTAIFEVLGYDVTVLLTEIPKQEATP